MIAISALTRFALQWENIPTYAESPAEPSSDFFLFLLGLFPQEQHPTSFLQEQSLAAPLQEQILFPQGQSFTLFPEGQGERREEDFTAAPNEPNRPDAAVLDPQALLSFLFPGLFVSTPVTAETLPAEQGNRLPPVPPKVSLLQQGLAVVGAQSFRPVAVGTESFAFPVLPAGLQSTEESPVMEQVLLPSLPKAAPPVSGVQSAQPTSLVVSFHLRARQGEEEVTAAFPPTEQQLTSADKTSGLAAATPPELPVVKTASSGVSALVPPVDPNLYAHSLKERAGKQEKYAEVLDTKDRTNTPTVPPVQTLEVNGRVDGKSLRLRGQDGSLASKRETFFTFPSALSVGERQAQGAAPGAQTLAPSPQPTAQVTAYGAEMWQAVIEQVASGISASLRRSSQEARLQLEPPELGKLDIVLVLEGGRVHARIVAESADVGALIQTHLPELKHALQSQRLDLDAVQVEVQGGGGERSNLSQGFQQDPRARAQGEAAALPQWVETEAEEASRESPPGRTGGVSVWA